MPSYQYRKSNCGDKRILRSSYIHNGIYYSGKIYTESGTSLTHFLHLPLSYFVHYHVIKDHVIMALTGPWFNIKIVFPGMGISIIKIERLWDRLVFIVGIRILVRQHLYVELVPSGAETRIFWRLWLFLPSPGHQQPWYWLCRINRFVSF